MMETLTAAAIAKLAVDAVIKTGATKLTEAGIRRAKNFRLFLTFDHAIVSIID